MRAIVSGRRDLILLRRKTLNRAGDSRPLSEEDLCRDKAECS